MNGIQIKDAFVSHNPKQEEILIMGGMQQFDNKELKKVAGKFGIKDFQISFSEIVSAAKSNLGVRKYLCYHLVYGERSPFWKNPIIN